MKNRRPLHVIGALATIAPVSLVGSGLLDHHEGWGDPRQAVANVLWIVFLLSGLALLAAGSRMALRRRAGAVR